MQGGISSALDEDDQRRILLVEPGSVARDANDLVIVEGGDIASLTIHANINHIGCMGLTKDSRRQESSGECHSSATFDRSPAGDDVVDVRSDQRIPGGPCRDRGCRIRCLFDLDWAAFGGVVGVYDCAAVEADSLNVAAAVGFCTCQSELAVPQGPGGWRRLEVIPPFVHLLPNRV